MVPHPPLRVLGEGPRSHEAAITEVQGRAVPSQDVRLADDESRTGVGRGQRRLAVEVESWVESADGFVLRVGEREGGRMRKTN